jgi:hypothetical protein
VIWSGNFYNYAAEGQLSKRHAWSQGAERKGDALKGLLKISIEISDCGEGISL